MDTAQIIGCMAISKQTWARLLEAELGEDNPGLVQNLNSDMRA